MPIGTPALVNVFKVRHGKETHVYRTETAADKKSLLSQFRHIAEELSAKKRKEREGEHERRKTLWAGGAVRCQTRALSCIL
jgi:exocyst complex component 8